MTHNAVKYPNPDEFRPERFFDADGILNNDTVSFVFGAGRRICAGRHVADGSVWAAIVSILATFDITNCKDEQGRDLPIDPKWTVGVTSYVPILRIDY